MKRISFLIVLALCASIFLASCSGSESSGSAVPSPAALPLSRRVSPKLSLPAPRVVDPTSRPFVLAYMTPDLLNDSTQRHYHQVKNEIAQRGWKLIEDTAVSYEASKTRRAFQNIVDQKPDAIILTFIEMEPLKDLIIEARQKRIGVYEIGSDELLDGVIMSTTTSNILNAATMISYAVDHMNRQGNVVGFFDFWAPRSLPRDATAACAIENCGYPFEKTLHHEISREGYIDEIYTVTSNWLKEYGNQLNFVWTHWDSGSISAAQAMHDGGYTENEMFTVGIDGGSKAWAAIRKGEIPFLASLAEPFEYQTHCTFEAIHQLQVLGMQVGQEGCIVPANGILTTNQFSVIIDKSNVPNVGANIHSVFNYYGLSADDPNSWFNQGTPYIVSE